MLVLSADNLLVIIIRSPLDYLSHETCYMIFFLVNNDPADSRPANPAIDDSTSTVTVEYRHNETTDSASTVSIPMSNNVVTTVRSTSNSSQLDTRLIITILGVLSGVLIILLLVVICGCLCLLLTRKKSTLHHTHTKAMSLR